MRDPPRTPTPSHPGLCAWTRVCPASGGPGRGSLAWAGNVAGSGGQGGVASSDRAGEGRGRPPGALGVGEAARSGGCVSVDLGGGLQVPVGARAGSLAGAAGRPALAPATQLPHWAAVAGVSVSDAPRVQQVLVDRASVQASRSDDVGRPRAGIGPRGPTAVSREVRGLQSSGGCPRLASECAGSHSLLSVGLGRSPGFAALCPPSLGAEPVGTAPSGRLRGEGRVGPARRRAEPGRLPCREWRPALRPRPSHCPRPGLLLLPGSPRLRQAPLPTSRAPDSAPSRARMDGARRHGPPDGQAGTSAQQCWETLCRSCALMK